MKKVLAFGTFDHLHPGHLYFLKQAKKWGDFLSVIVARDENVKKIKGKWPENSEKKRYKTIKKLDFVNEVFLGEENLDNKYNIIKKIKPDIIALGYDQKFFIKNLPAVIKKIGKPCQIIRLDSFKPEKYKSSLFRAKTKK